MISLILTGCLTALAAAFIFGITIIALAVIVYFIATVIRSMVEVYRKQKETDILSNNPNQHK